MLHSLVDSAMFVCESFWAIFEKECLRIRPNLITFAQISSKHDKNETILRPTQTHPHRRRAKA